MSRVDSYVHVKVNTINKQHVLTRPNFGVDRCRYVDTHNGVAGGADDLINGTHYGGGAIANINYNDMCMQIVAVLPHYPNVRWLN